LHWAEFRPEGFVSNGGGGWSGGERDEFSPPGPQRKKEGRAASLVHQEGKRMKGMGQKGEKKARRRTFASHSRKKRGKGAGRAGNGAKRGSSWLLSEKKVRTGGRKKGKKTRVNHFVERKKPRPQASSLVRREEEKSWYPSRTPVRGQKKGSSFFRIFDKTCMRGKGRMFNPLRTHNGGGEGEIASCTFRRGERLEDPKRSTSKKKGERKKEP